jgi:cell wall-associated NlpC family hydrolase
MENLARGDQRQLQSLADGSQNLAADNAALQNLLTDLSRQEAELGGLTAQVEKDLATLTALRAEIRSSSRNSPTTLDSVGSLAPPPAVSGGAATAVQFAYAQIGKPYQWGAAGPGSYDCSGLTSAAWQAAGVSMPHNAARQYSAVAHISRADLRPGDLVFYYADIHHVAIYVGDGSVIHAPTAGQTVRVARLDHAPIHGYGRPS